MRFNPPVPVDFATLIVPDESEGNEAEDPQVIHFGRYAGRIIETIPRFYLSWVRVFGGISEEQREAIETHLEAGRKR